MRSRPHWDYLVAVPNKVNPQCAKASWPSLLVRFPYVEVKVIVEVLTADVRPARLSRSAHEVFDSYLLSSVSSVEAQGWQRC